MNRNKMNVDENLVDNEDEKEDEVLEDVEDREKDDDDVSEKNTSKQRTKRQKKNDIKEKKKLKYDAAISAFKSGDYTSACAKDFGVSVNQSSLALYLKSGNLSVEESRALCSLLTRRRELFSL